MSFKAAPEEGDESEYEGPLDIVSGAVVAFDNRGYGSAAIGNPLYDILRTSDGGVQTFDVEADGSAPSAEISTYVGAATFNKTGEAVDTSADVLLTNAAGVVVGQLVSCANFPIGTYVADTFSAPTIRLSNPASGSDAAASFTFTQQGKVSKWCGVGFDVDDNGGAGVLWKPNIQNGIPGMYKFGDLTADTLSLSLPNGGFTLFVVAVKDFELTLEDGAGAELSCLMSRGNAGEFYLTDGTNTCGAEFAPTGDSNAHIYEVSSQFGATTLLIDGAAQLDDGSLDDGGAVSAVTMTDCTIAIGRIFDEYNSPGFAIYLWPSVLSAGNKTAIRTNIATYYGISI